MVAWRHWAIRAERYLDDTTKAWIARVSMLMALIFIIYIVIRNRLNYITVTENSQNNEHKLPKHLQIWSQMVFVACYVAIVLFASIKIPYLCEYTYYFSSAAICTPHIFLSFFQISRLSFCFNHNQLQSIGYSKFIFKILYAIGIFGLLVSFIYGFFVFDPYNLPNYNGCWYRGKTFYTFEVSVGLYVMYLLWDWTIVTLYVAKLCQIKRTIRGEDNKTVLVLQKINLTLQKILLLTLFSEFAIFPILWLDMIGIIGRSFGWSLDFMLIGCVMYLMLEHNNQDFIKLLKCLHRCGCDKCLCCCFGKFILDQKHNIKSDDQHANVDQNDVEVIQHINEEKKDKSSTATVSDHHTFIDIDTTDHTLIALEIKEKTYSERTDIINVSSTAL